MIVVLLSVALALSLVTYRADVFERFITSPFPDVPLELSSHPVYSSYRFGSNNKVIDIGTQPLFLPGVISEVMKRDETLKSVLAEHGVEVRFHSFLKGADVNFFLARGDLEAGIGGDMPTLVACANSYVLVTSLIDQHFVAMVARQTMMIPELKGKRVGYAYGSQAHYTLLEALASEGLGEDDVTMVLMDVDSMPDALHDGSIDAFSAWEPTPAIAMSKYPDLVPIGRTLTTGYLYFSGQFTDNSPEFTRLVVASQLRAMMWITASAENLRMASSWALSAASEMGGDITGISADLLSSVVNEGLLGISSSASINAKSLADNSVLFREFRFLQNLGEVPDNTSWHRLKKCFDLAMVPEITSHAEQYRLNVQDFVTGLPGTE